MKIKKITMSISTGKNPNEINLKDGYADFIRAKKAKNLSDDSLISYDNVFKGFCAVIPDDTLCSSVRIEHFYYFIEAKKENNPNISDRSIETYMRHLRAIFYFFMEKGYMNPYKIEMPKYDEESKDPFSDEDIARLLKKPNIEKAKFTDYRNWVICCFFLGSGIRQNTLCNIKIGNLDFENKIIRLSTVKNRRSYNIPMSLELADILTEYLAYRKGDSNDFLFCNVYCDQLKRSAIKTAMVRYSKARGVEQHGTHIYRHTFAKYFVLGGGSLTELQEVLGHCSIEMARHYVKLYSKDLQKDFEKRNPLDVNASLTKEKKLIKIRKP